MKIFEVDSVDDLKDGTVATEVDGKGNPIDHSVQKPPPPEPQVALVPQETKEEKNARIARENMEMLAEEEQKFEDENHGLRFAIRPIKALSIGKIELRTCSKPSFFLFDGSTYLCKKSS